MRRLPLALLLWSLLSAAGPAPVRLTPEQPQLGVPLLLTIELPDAATELAGLPALTPFELLEPPQRREGELRLLLLPMRPGVQQIPSLPLRQGETRQLATAALTLTVDEGIPATATPAPLKSLATESPAVGFWPFALLPAALAAAWLGGVRRRRRIKQATPPLDDLTEERLLAELHRRLTLATALPEPLRQQLKTRLEKLRFAPGPPDKAEISRLLADVLALTEVRR